jgi:hypothetical protein
MTMPPGHIIADLMERFPQPYGPQKENQHAIYFVGVRCTLKTKKKLILTSGVSCAGGRLNPLDTVVKFIGQCPCAAAPHLLKTDPSVPISGH